MRSKKITLLVWFLLISGLPVYLYSAYNGNIKNKKAVSLVNDRILFSNQIHKLYQEIGLDTAGLEYKVFYKAVVGYYNLKNENKLSEKPIITVADFSKPSTEDRLYVVDLEAKKLLFHTLVAHGRGTGENIASEFSNTPNSFMSSLGFYTTAEIYNGAHDFSLKLDGQEKGINDKARERGIVMHAADYVSKEFVQTVGRLGRSQGCPAVSNTDCKPIIETIANGTCFFIYNPSKKYTNNSRILKNEKLAVNTFFNENQALLASLKAEIKEKNMIGNVIGTVMAK